MPNDWELTSKLVTAVLALYGAVLSTYNLIVSKRRALKVEAAIVPHTEHGKPAGQVFVIVAVNIGRRVVIVNEFGVRGRGLWLNLDGKADTDPRGRPWSLGDGEDFKGFPSSSQSR